MWSVVPIKDSHFTTLSSACYVWSFESLAPHPRHHNATLCTSNIPVQSPISLSTIPLPCHCSNAWRTTRAACLVLDNEWHYWYRGPSSSLQGRRDVGEEFRSVLTVKNIGAFVADFVACDPFVHDGSVCFCVTRCDLLVCDSQIAVTIIRLTFRIRCQHPNIGRLCRLFGDDLTHFTCVE
jgi:hypothetical protein